MKKWILSIFILATTALLLGGCEATPSGQVQNTIKSIPDTLLRVRMDALATYLDSTDLATSVSSDSLFYVLHRLKYGQRPPNMSHLAQKESIDTTGLVQTITRFFDSDNPRFIDEIRALEPGAQQYHVLKNHYKRLLREEKNDSLVIIQKSLNVFRWIQRYTTGTFALINIPSAELLVNDSLGKETLRMRVIVGTRRNQTPSFATYTNEIITYPYWNVPRSIATKEILPKVKRNVGYLANNNMQVIGKSGRALDPYSISWASFNASNFPYRFRQSTGCDNALGVVKFNLASPYAIYMHDTNSRSLFSREYRWLSHGCIRLEKPAELANYILNEPLFDEEFLNQCLIGAKPGSIKPSKPLPVFIMYMLADVDEQGRLRWNKNVYNWR